MIETLVDVFIDVPFNVSKCSNCKKTTICYKNGLHYSMQTKATYRSTMLTEKKLSGVLSSSKAKGFKVFPCKQVPMLLLS